MMSHLIPVTGRKKLIVSEATREAGCSPINDQQSLLVSSAEFFVVCWFQICPLIDVNALSQLRWLGNILPNPAHVLVFPARFGRTEQGWKKHPGCQVMTWRRNASHLTTMGRRDEDCSWLKTPRNMTKNPMTLTRMWYEMPAELAFQHKNDNAKITEFLR